MMNQIQTINLLLPFKMGSVNCYLIKSESGFILIDTGSSNMRDRLVQELERAGCQPGDLNLILITQPDRLRIDWPPFVKATVDRDRLRRRPGAK